MRVIRVAPAGCSLWCQRRSWHEACLHLCPAAEGCVRDMTPKVTQVLLRASRSNPFLGWLWWCVWCRSPLPPGHCHWSGSPVARWEIGEVITEYRWKRHALSINLWRANDCDSWIGAEFSRNLNLCFAYLYIRIYYIYILANARTANWFSILNTKHEK